MSFRLSHVPTLRLWLATSFGLLQLLVGFVAALFALPVMAQAAEHGAPAGSVIFAAGPITISREGAGGIVVRKGLHLLQGDVLSTSDAGYMYVRMADDALLVVRPNSHLRIDRWHYDASRPEQSEIKYTLDHGVARYVSGKGSKAAKDKFRFNTPLAAIGVRGTDFTVLAETQRTLISVASGGVVVGSLGGGCLAEALGPCEGDRVSELFANNVNKILEVSQHDRLPRLIDMQKAGGADEKHPAAADEPQARSSGASGTNAKNPLTNEDPKLSVVGANSPAPVQPIVHVPDPLTTWGRWGRVGDGTDDLNVVREVLAGRTLVGINKYYVLALNSGSPMELPGTGVGRFQMVSHQGVMLNPHTNKLDETSASNALLSIDFSTRRFTTSMDLTAGENRSTISSQGSIENGGVMRSDLFISSTVIDGIVGGSAGSQASYIYRRSPDHGLEVSGITHWTK